MKKLPQIFLLATTLTIFLFGACRTVVPLGEPSPTAQPTPTLGSTPTTLPKPAPTESPMLQDDPFTRVCPGQSELSIAVKQAISGKLIYGDGYQLLFPEMLEKDPLVQDKILLFSYEFLSSDNRYLLARVSSYTSDWEYLGETLDTYSANLDLVQSYPMKENWLRIMGWATNNRIVIQTTDRNIEVIDPFQEEQYQLHVETNPDTDEKWLISYSPDIDLVAVLYANQTGSRSRLEVWNINEQKIIWETDTLFSWGSEILWAHNRKQFAVETEDFMDLTTNSEISVIANDGRIIYQSDLAQQFDQIAILNLSWGPDDQSIYFWATYDEILGEKLQLFKWDFVTDQLYEFCFSGEFGNFGNQMIWLPDNPGWVILRNKSGTSTSATYETLLVDMNTNVYYKIGENLTLIGWMRK